MFFAFLPLSFCLVTALMSPLTVLDTFDFHTLIFFFLNLICIRFFSPCPTHEILFSCSQLLLNFFPSQILRTVWLLCCMSATINLFPWIPFGVRIPNLTSPCIKCSMLQLFTYFSWHNYSHSSAKTNINAKSIALFSYCHPFA